MISSKRREEAIGCQGAQGWKLEVDIEVKRQIPCPGYEFKRSASYLQHTRVVGADPELELDG